MEEKELQIIITEIKVLQLTLNAFLPRIVVVSCAHEQHHGGGVSEEAQEHCLQGNVQSNTGDLGMVRAAHSDTLSEVYPRKEGCLHRLAESPRPEPTHGMVFSSSGV